MMRKREYLDCRVCGEKVLQTEYANDYMTLYPSRRSGRGPQTYHNSCYNKLSIDEQRRIMRLFHAEDVPMRFEEKRGIFMEVEY